MRNNNNNKDWGKIERSLSVAVSESKSTDSNKGFKPFLSSPLGTPKHSKHYEDDGLDVLEQFQHALRYACSALD